MRLREYFLTRSFPYSVAMIILTLLIVSGLWMVIGIFQPAPPRTVTMATGSAGGAYHGYGERYREILKREGVELKLEPTTGAIENLRRLNDPSAEIDVSFLQGGTTNSTVSPQLESLGTVFYEPLWFFCRDNFIVKSLEELRGHQIAIGPEGSGTRSLSLELLARNGITESNTDLLSLSFQAGSEKLLRGEIDAMLILAAWESSVVQRLLVAKGVDLVDFPHADAYVALLPFLSKIVVPSGVGDLVRRRPPKDITVLAAKASLVVRNDLHPAIQFLLLDAAEQIHPGGGIFQKTGQFPAAESIDLPLSDEARRFYRSGQPFLQRYLPFWMAVLIHRLLVMLIPLLGIIYPLLRYVPVLYGWKMQRRIFKLYNELKSIEQTWESRDPGSSSNDLKRRLNQLEHQADHLWLPVSCMGTLYMFKEHIALVRERLETLPPQP